MEDSADLIERWAQIDGCVGSSFSLSNSGSSACDAEKRNGPGTYVRPKLPSSLMHQQPQVADQPVEPRHGRIFPVVPVHEAIGAITRHNGREPEEESDKLNKYLADAQQLVAQLEVRSALNGQSPLQSSKNNGERMTAEDAEVSETLIGAEYNVGLNQRLLALLQRRNGTAANGNHTHKTNGSTTTSASQHVPNQKPASHLQPRRQLKISSNSTPRTQSQQPTSRMKETTANDRYDSHTNASRAASQTRGSFGTDSESGSNNSKNTKIQRPSAAHSTSDQRAMGTARSKYGSNEKQKPATTDGSKLNALQSWKRRKAYDPKISLNGSGRNIDSPNENMHPNGSPGKFENHIPNSSRPNYASNRTTRRTTPGSNRTAPVETADCLAALESIQTQMRYPAHCSVVPNILINHSKDPMDASGKKTPTPGVTSSAVDRRARGSVVRSGAMASGISQGKARSNRSSSQNTGELTTSLYERSRVAKINGIQNRTTIPKTRLPVVNTARVPDRRQNGPARSVSQASHRDGGTAREANSVGHANHVLPNHNAWEDVGQEPNYPDMAVESIRYKIEKLTNFILRLRKRIERDYAEQGTCSPGDDVFGDEAVGATVAGRSTGMHPVVASSLKNLRVLEFNAQEIFSLLYPTEIDLWGPERECMDSEVINEQMYNEARSRLTEHLSESIQRSEGESFNHTALNTPRSMKPNNNLTIIPQIPTDIPAEHGDII